MYCLSLEDVEYIAFQLAQSLMQWDEPFPDFNTRFPDRLESSLITPYQTFDGKQLYKGFYKKTSILFYLLNKNHPFENGNKRIAVTTLMVHLIFNKRFLKATPEEFYKFAITVASSSPNEKDNQLLEIEKFLRTHTVTLKKYANIIQVSKIKDNRVKYKIL